MKKYDGIKQTALDNVISSDDVCKMLNRTRQHINILTNSGEIPLFKKFNNCNLYWKQDILQYIAKRDQNNLFEHHIIEGGSSDQALKKAKEICQNEEIVEVYVCFDTNDLIDSGFYYTENESEMNTLNRIIAPDAVIITSSGKEYWLNGFKCGYYGKGPNKTIEMCKHIGIPEEIEKQKISDLVHKYDVVRFYKNEKWHCEFKESIYRTAGEFGNSSLMAQYYRSDNKMVLLQVEALKENKIEPENPWIRFIDAYSHFMISPQKMKILSKREALETGHFLIEFGRTKLFQVVIMDNANREIWLQYGGNKSIETEYKSVASLYDVIEGLNIIIEEDEKKRMDKFTWTWITTKLRLIRDNIIK